MTLLKAKLLFETLRDDRVEGCERIRKYILMRTHCRRYSPYTRVCMCAGTFWMYIQKHVTRELSNVIY